MAEALQIFEFTYRGSPALWFFSSNGVSHSTDEPYGRRYDVRGPVGRAFVGAIKAMRLWLERGGDVAALPSGWTLVDTVEAGDVELAAVPLEVMH